ncbi:DUF2124 family protein [Methanobacterium sp.]|uniref:DUF2124 family protein n=1 Tax=Methanobacterium sp. TaxID=2164 RepID=UPI003C70AC68
MKKISEFTGITENLLAFREEVKDAEKITFIGMPGVCSPFALLFAYVVKEKESVFISGTDIKSARKLKLTEQGMEFGESANPHADVVAILGGLAMPKTNIKPDEINKIIKNVLKKDGKLMGLCYMDIFREYGWDQKLNFDCIINGTLNGFILRK